MLPCTGQEYLVGLLYERYYECYFSGAPVRLTAGRSLSYVTKPLQERGGAFLRHIG